MAEWVVDASVLLKLIIDEDDSAKAEFFFETQKELVAPSIIYAEVGNTLWKHVKIIKSIPAAEDAMALYDCFDVFKSIIPIEMIANHALELSLRLDHPVYDCYYLALAAQRGGKIITADKRFQQKLNNSEFKHNVMSLSEWNAN